MATPIVYPAALPIPQTSEVRGKDRRKAADSSYPRGQVIAIERDRIEFERVTWPPMKQAQAAALRAWWRDQLFDGAAWFSATWPLPRGMVSAVRKFTSTLDWEYIAGGFWRVSGETEVRGRGMAPNFYPVVEVPILLETFSGPDGSYIGSVPMDIVLKGGTWTTLGDTAAPQYDGQGNAVSGNGDPSPGVAEVQWGDFNGTSLNFGWRFELTLDALQGLPNESYASTIFELYEYSSELLSSTRVVIDDRIRVTADFNYGEATVSADYDLPVGEFTFSMRFPDYYVAIVSINGVDQAPLQFADGGAYGFMFYFEFMYLVVGALTADPEEPTTKFSRIAIYNGPE